MYADHNDIFYSHESGNDVVIKLQNALNRFSNYTKKWKIKLNENKTHLFHQKNN